MQNYDDLTPKEWKDWGKYTHPPQVVDEGVFYPGWLADHFSQFSAREDCEHHWVSSHQPDFPREIYWIEQCSLCDRFNGAALKKSVEGMLARIDRLEHELLARGLGHAVARLRG